MIDIKGTGSNLVLFYTDWSKNAKSVLKLVNDLQKRVKHIDIKLINADIETALVEKYKIKSVPTLLYFQERELIWKHQGIIDKEELLAKIKLSQPD